MKFIEILPNEISKKDYSLLVKHNNLVQGKYCLEASEQKLLYKIFEEVQKKGYSTREVQMSFQDFYLEYKGILGKNITKSDFKNLIESLQDKKPYIIKGNDYIRTQWYKIHGKLDLSEVKLILDEDVFDYVQALDKNFTGLRLETLYSFKSFHSMRIYELLKQWCDTRSEIAYSLESLKELLGVENNKGYNNFTNFNKYVIQKALSEINDKSELKVKAERIKEGRSIVGLSFNVSYKEKKLISKPNDIVSTKDIEVIDDRSNFFIPKVLTIDEKLIPLFERQFNKYSFESSDYHAILLEAEASTFKKDNAKNINALNYKLFAKILKSKIDSLEFRKETESKELEEDKLFNALNEEQRIEAEILNMTAKEYLDFMMEFEVDKNKEDNKILNY